jgi:hypothetical protein
MDLSRCCHVPVTPSLTTWRVTPLGIFNRQRRHHGNEEAYVRPRQSGSPLLWKRLPAIAVRFMGLFRLI